MILLFKLTVYLPFVALLSSPLLDFPNWAQLSPLKRRACRGRGGRESWTGWRLSLTLLLFLFTLMHSAKEEKKIPKNSLENFLSFISIKVDTESRYEAYAREGGVITPAQLDNRSS